MIIGLGFALVLLAIPPASGWFTLRSHRLTCFWTASCRRLACQGCSRPHLRPDTDRRQRNLWKRSSPPSPRPVPPAPPCSIQCRGAFGRWGGKTAAPAVPPRQPRRHRPRPKNTVPTLPPWRLVDCPAGFAPAPGLLARNHIVAASAGKDAVPFDLMRTRLLQQMRANQWRRVAITSPGPACGKSTIALNLAMSLARQPDLRTVLAEMDMRRPSLSRMLGCAPRKALPVCWKAWTRSRPRPSGLARTWRSAPVTPPTPVRLNCCTARRRPRLLTGSRRNMIPRSLSSTCRPCSSRTMRWR